MNKLLIILFFCAGFKFSYAQPASYDSLSDEQTVQDLAQKKEVLADTVLLIHEMNIPEENIRLLKKKKEFLYLKKMDSLLKARKEDSLRDNRSANNISLFEKLLHSGFLQFFLWSLALIFILFILYNLLSSRGIFKKAGPSIQPGEHQVLPDSFYVQDFGKLVSQSCRLGDYRMAVRYLFLQTLQQLNEKSIIEYAPDKTNSSYAREIRQDKRNEFAALILHYEYIWYGNISIVKEGYEKIEQHFSAFFQKLHNR